MGFINLDLQEWENRFLPHTPALKEGFLQDKKALTQAHVLTESGFVNFQESLDGIIIGARSHVGRIRLGGLTLTIRPKIPFPSLMYLLEYTYDLQYIRRISEVDLITESTSFHDLLIFLLIQEVSNLLTQGLYRHYRSQTADLISPRGRIDFQRLTCGSWEATLPCRYHERSFDCLVNQVLLAGLQLAAEITSSVHLRARLYRLIKLMDGVSKIRLHQGAIRRLTREDNRLIAAYRPSIRLISLLYDNYGVALHGKNLEMSVPGFLFDMNRFFQALLGRFLRENLASGQVFEEYKLKDVFDYQWEFNPLKRRAPTLRPDFAVSINGRVAALLDAKYRDLWQHELPRDMLYQLAIYALAHDSKASAILYPTDSPEASEARMVINDPVTGTGAAVVSLRPVYLPKLVELVTLRGGIEAERRRQEYARYLVMGFDGHDILWGKAS